MKTILKWAFAFLAVTLLMPSMPFGLQAQVAAAQTTISSTTLSTAITSPQNTTGNQVASSNVTVASLGSGSTAILAGYVLFMDGEAMQVRTVPTTGTTLTVNRAYMGTRAAPHAANVIIYYGPSQAFVSGNVGQFFYGGSCTASTYQYLPIIDVRNAMVGTCNSTTSLWTWFSLWPSASQIRPRTPVVDANYTATVFDEIIAYTSLTASRIVTLPSATGLAGKIIIIKDESGSASGSKIIFASGAGIDGSTTPALVTSVGSIRLFSNGTNWFTW